MGGLAQNLTCNSTIRGCIDTGNTLHRTQYITSWPFAHPWRAPAFFSLHMKCDRKQRNGAFRRALHHLPSVRDLCYFLRTDGIVVPSRTWTSSASLGPGSRSVLFCWSNWCINGAIARCRCYSICAREKRPLSAAEQQAEMSSIIGVPDASWKSSTIGVISPLCCLTF